MQAKISRRKETSEQHRKTPKMDGFPKNLYAVEMPVEARHHEIEIAVAVPIHRHRKRVKPDTEIDDEAGMIAEQALHLRGGCECREYNQAVV